ncbi:MAG: cupin domain-containing protein, partial [Amphritea sp.]|nr:cupin domain-containing protein [Amphritea sp.]
GVSESDDCMTYSVGFRAPSHAEIMRNYTDFIGEKLTSEFRYNDPDLTLQDSAGEISPSALQKVRQIFTDYLNDDEKLAQWLGQSVTEAKYTELDQSPEEPVTAEQIADVLTQEDIHFIRNEGSRLSYYRQSDDHLQLFADGKLFNCNAITASLAVTLSDNVALVINQGEWHQDQLQLLADLYNQGSLYIE